MCEIHEGMQNLKGTRGIKAKQILKLEDKNVNISLPSGTEVVDWLVCILPLSKATMFFY